VNSLGQVVKQVSLSSKNNYSAEVIDLPSGIYFVTGQKNNLKVTKKIIVQN
jgi:Secretion system C-terminal sorting domain